MAAARLLARSDAGRGTWGDAGPSGQTIDRVYVLDDEVCSIAFELPVGGRFIQLGEDHPVYERDVVWRVLRGVLVASNPATGETHRVRAGESLHFDGSVWPSGFNYGSEPVEVMELTAPARGRSSVTETPPPSDPRHGREELVGRWPADRAAAEASATFRLLGTTDLVWRLEGEPRPVLVGHVISTPHLTVGELHLLAGSQTGLFEHPGVKTVHVLEGALSLQLPDSDDWIEVRSGDGAYIPAGLSHRMVSLTGETTQVLFQVVPGAAAAGHVFSRP